MKSDNASEPSNQRIDRIELKVAVENLLQVVTEQGACVAGYIFRAGDSPFVFCFKNIKEEGTELSKVLLEIGDEAERRILEGTKPTRYHIKPRSKEQD